MTQRYFFKTVVMLAVTIACLNQPVFADIYPSAPLPPPPPVAPPSFPPIPDLPVSLNVATHKQGSLTQILLDSTSNQYRAYLQAKSNERYTIIVSNNSEQRVGVVIAVDGRNIISGKQSDLTNTERMYVLNPNTVAEFEGWRTGKNQVNRFYFTESSRSYAAKWGDASAMGVIAMAVYPEKPQPAIAYPMEAIPPGSADEAAAQKSAVIPPSADAASSVPAADAAAAPPAPGTGFGKTMYSPSVTVDFQPDSEPMEKIFLKYEWRKTLCDKGILPDCRKNNHRPPNRFWPDDSNSGYAPPPPNS